MLDKPNPVSCVCLVFVCGMTECRVWSIRPNISITLSKDSTTELQHPGPGIFMGFFFVVVVFKAVVNLLSCFGGSSRDGDSNAC